MSVFVIVHGAWHRGEQFEASANHLRAMGHTVYCPTLAGNAEGDSKSLGLKDAINSVVNYLDQHALSDFILCGHSYGGMVITGVADRVPERIRRLVYWNAFVPNNGESLNDMVPPHLVAMFEQLQAPDHSITLPFEVFRELFLNDADLPTCEAAYAELNPHPAATFSDAIELTQDPALMPIAKSYINCTEDTALPQSAGWHPRLSEKLGVFRLVQIPGSHELCFSDPKALALAFACAGRD